MLSWNDEPATQTGLATGLADAMRGKLPLSSPSRAATGVFGDAAMPTPGLTQSPVAATSAARVNVADKRIINGQTDVNQLVPFKYK